MMGMLLSLRSNAQCDVSGKFLSAFLGFLMLRPDLVRLFQAHVADGETVSEVLSGHTIKV